MIETTKERLARRKKELERENARAPKVSRAPTKLEQRLLGRS